MATNIGPRIGIDGYAQYKAEMQSIIAQIQNYKAQCDALSNSEEDLRKKQQLQAEQIKLQTDLMAKQSEWNAKVKQSVENKKTITERDTAVLTQNQTALLNQNTELVKLTAEYDKTTKELNEFNEEQKETGENAEQTTQQISGATIALGDLMAKVVEKGAQLVKQAADLGIEYNASMETYTAAFSTLLGSTDEAEYAIESIRELSKGIPTFSTSALAKGTQMIVATGKSANEATADMRALANAVAASGGGNPELERMAQNLQQIGNAGKATKMDIRQFAYAGINVTKLLADYTGKTTEEVEKMTVTYDLLTGALRYAATEGGMYFGGLEAQAQTYNGQISALKKNIEEGLGYAFEGLTGELESNILPKLNEFFSDTDNIDKLVNLIEDFGVAAVTFTTVSKFTDFLTTNKTAVALFTGKITAAQAATSLWGTALSALPLVLVTAGVTAVVHAVRRYNEEVDNIKAGLISENTNLEETQENLAKVRQEYDQLIDDNTNARGRLVMSDELRKEKEAYEKAIEELEKQEAEFIAKQEEAARIEALPETQVNRITENVRMAFDEMKAAYDEAYNSAMKAALKEFDLFEKVGELAYTSTKDLAANLETQTAYWDLYAANLEYVADEQVGLNKELISFLSDGTQDSAGYLQSIVTDIMNAGGATTEAGQQIIADLNAKFSALQAAQESYAAETAVAVTDIETKIKETVDNAVEELNKLDLSDQMYTNGVNSIVGYANGMASETQGILTQAYLLGKDIGLSIQNGYNAFKPGITVKMTGYSGFVQGSHAKGLDYVPEDNYIAALHKGEMVLTAAQANAVRSGAYQQSIANKTTNYGGVNVNVYASEGQSAEEIAEDVAYILQSKVERKEAVYK